jgi:hypothetical protein
MVGGQQHAGRVAECERAETVMSLLGDSLLPPEQQSFDNMADAAEAAGVERWRHRNVVYVKRGAGHGPRTVKSGRYYRCCVPCGAPKSERVHRDIQVCGARTQCLLCFPLQRTPTANHATHSLTRTHTHTHTHSPLPRARTGCQKSQDTHALLRGGPSSAGALQAGEWWMIWWRVWSLTFIITCLTMIWWRVSSSHPPSLTMTCLTTAPRRGTAARSRRRWWWRARDVVE